MIGPTKFTTERHGEKGMMNSRMTVDEKRACSSIVIRHSCFVIRSYFVSFVSLWLIALPSIRTYATGAIKGRGRGLNSGFQSRKIRRWPPAYRRVPHECG
jgi:hypothetical protein